MDSRPFESFSKIQRLGNLTMVVTEKIDGTNAAVVITEDGDIYAQSRNRVITPEDDNYGFAAWVAKNADDLKTGLGSGRHFGEWWGLGIQRGYDQDRKRFSLFNTGRWNLDNIPSCCDVVPIVDHNAFSREDLDLHLEGLQRFGSIAAPGFMRPEGLIVFIPRVNMYLKHVIDPKPKGPKTNRHDVLAT